MEISNFVKLNISYHLSKFPIFWFSGSNFMEVSVKPPKHYYDVILYHCISKLAYFVEHDIGYQPSKFQCSRMSESNFIEGGGSPPEIITWAFWDRTRPLLHFVTIQFLKRCHFCGSRPVIV